MDKDTKIAMILVAILGLPLLSLAILGWIPTWFGIMGNWVKYMYWFNISCTVGRWIYGLMIIVIPITSFYTEEWKYLGYIPACVLLAVWGIPILYQSIYNLVMVELTGLDLQRTIMQILIIELFANNAFRDNTRGKKND